MSDYDEKDIILLNWPKVDQLSSGLWRRVWEIELCERPMDSEVLAATGKLLSNEEIEVEIASAETRLTVSVTTVRWGWENDFLFYSYRLLCSINKHIGEIRTIQDQPRDLWPPWSRFKLGLLDPNEYWCP